MLGSRLAPAILVIPVAVVLLCFWPGHMNADTITSIGDVATHHLGDRHAPLLEALWIPFWDLGFGPGWVLGAQVAAFVAGAYFILRTALSPVAAAVVAAVVAFSPPVFGLLGLIGRDSWFIGLLLLTFGLTCVAARTRGGRRRWLLLGALIAGWLALASRQNAAPAVVAAMIALVVVARSARGRDAWTVKATWTTIGLGVLLTLVLGATQFAATAALDVRADHPTQYVYEYDLASISRQERQNLFPADVMPQRGIATIDRYWYPDNSLRYVTGPGHPVNPFLSDAQTHSLSRAWWTAVREHLGDYVQTRWDLFMRQIAVTRAAKQIYHPGIDRNPFGFAIRFHGPNQVARSYVESFATPTYDGDLLFRVWCYLVMSAGVTWYFLRPASLTSIRVCLGALAGSALLYQTGLALGATGVQYRFEYPAVVATIITAIVAIAFAVRDRRDKARAHLGSVER